MAKLRLLENWPADREQRARTSSREWLQTALRSIMTDVGAVLQFLNAAGGNCDDVI
jgi:hypothetical protein